MVRDGRRGGVFRVQAPSRPCCLAYDPDGEAGRRMEGRAGRAEWRDWCPASLMSQPLTPGEGKAGRRGKGSRGAGDRRTPTLQPPPRSR
jgi:hypothetical protein